MLSTFRLVNEHLHSSTFVAINDADQTSNSHAHTWDLFVDGIAKPSNLNPTIKSYVKIMDKSRTFGSTCPKQIKDALSQSKRWRRNIPCPKPIKIVQGCNPTFIFVLSLIDLRDPITLNSGLRPALMRWKQLTSMRNVFANNISITSLHFIKLSLCERLFLPVTPGSFTLTTFAFLNRSTYSRPNSRRRLNSLRSLLISCIVKSNARSKLSPSTR